MNKNLEATIKFITYTRHLDVEQRQLFRKIIGFCDGRLYIGLVGRQNALWIFLVFLVVEEHYVWTYRGSGNSHEPNEQYVTYWGR
jgi:hypothetical protein